MELHWIKYEKGGKPVYKLILPIGSKNGKICCLDTEYMANDDKSFVRQNISKLSKMDMDDKIEFLKKQLASFKRSYRTLMAGNVETKKKYQIK